MTDPGPVVWPPAPITTRRLVLREPEARDRAGFVELFGSAEVGVYLGGPKSPEALNALPDVPGRRLGVFVVETGGRMIGTVMLERRNLGPEDRVRPESGEVDLGYLFLPEAWGHGYAAEACSAALDWFTSTFPGEPVVLVTQSANERSMRLAAKLGFTEERRFHRFGAEQWFGIRHPVNTSYKSEG
jgi:RimJ/RimL family protein N-acetyltransferase